ncbi:hypothetical protein [Tolumonas lignilytica]|uniref:hypothetical protein n=1 Tax=Tolumonas lignilytica TaxID=1283284 RepID=UPI00046536C7|nr:hypothetical protein [Tolumonas lignilytica]
MEDIIKSIKAFLYDRSSSPLFGAYIISWIISNYKFFIIAISDVKPQVKISLISEIYDQHYALYSFTISHRLIDGFICPAFLTVLYIYIYPMLAVPVYEYSLQRQKRLREIKQKNDDNRLLSVAESRELILQISKLKNENQELSLQHRLELSAVTEQLNALKSEADKNPSTISNKNTSIFDTIEYLIDKSEKLQNGEYAFYDIVNSTKANGLISDEKAFNEIEKLFTDRVKSRKIKHLRMKNEIYILKSDKFENLLNSEEESVLNQFLQNNRAELSAEDISRTTVMNNDLVRVILSSLYDVNYISIVDDYNSKRTYTITDRGRKYLVENDFIK